MLEKILILWIVIHFWYTDTRVIRAIKDGVLIIELPEKLRDMFWYIDAVFLTFLLLIIYNGSF